MSDMRQNPRRNHSPCDNVFVTDEGYFYVWKLCFPLLLESSGYNIGYTQKGWAPNDFDVYGWDSYPLGKSYSQKQVKPLTNQIVKNDYFNRVLFSLKKEFRFCIYSHSSITAVHFLTVLCSLQVPAAR